MAKNVRLASFLYQGDNMSKVIKLSLLAIAISVISGCTGSVYNKQKNCDYDYLLHPAISISKIIGGCGPVDQ
jgi:hypothetical protein